MELIRPARRRRFRERTSPAGRSPWVVALVLVTGCGPLATDAYLPALPQVQRALATSASWAQLTMTAFIVGSAVGMLLLGPISDGLGRRKLILAAVTAFAASSLVCAVTPGIEILIAARLVQGAASGAGAAIGLAVVSDRYQGNAAARMFGTLISINLVAPVIAPAIGAAILTVGDWRTVFWCLIGVGVLMLVSRAWAFPKRCRSTDDIRADCAARPYGWGSCSAIGRSWFRYSSSAWPRLDSSPTSAARRSSCKPSWASASSATH